MFATKFSVKEFLLPILAFLIGAIAISLWWSAAPASGTQLRLPGADKPPGTDAAALENPASSGKTTSRQVSVPLSKGNWPQFRGPNRDGINTQQISLAREWPKDGPAKLWSVDCGEGYAGAAVNAGRVYLMDYDSAKKENILRCLSLSDGAECWRYSYRLALKRNHGVTRSVPAVSGNFVVAIDPKCNLLCADARTGDLRWSMNLVHEYGATIPPWYTGQCPLIDGNAVIIAPGGPTALLAAIDIETGKPLWRSPNPNSWKMTHSSIVPMEFAGQRFYVYCASGGVAGISANNGAILWETKDWKISIATVPSPLILDAGRIFLSGGYNAGSAMLRLENINGKLTPKTLFRLDAGVFGATQHTPIYYGGSIYGVRPDGQFACLDLTGKVRWTSPSSDGFGLGSFLLADGRFFVMNDSGDLSMLEATPEKCIVLAKAKVLDGRESWGPMALVDGRLLVRDFTKLECLQVASKPSDSSGISQIEAVQKTGQFAISLPRKVESWPKTVRRGDAD